MDYEMKHFDRKPVGNVFHKRISRRGAVIWGVVTFVGVLIFLIVCYVYAYPELHRDDFYREAFSEEDRVLVQEVLDAASVEMGPVTDTYADSYFRVLFDAQWERKWVKYDIVAAEMVFFSEEEISELYGDDYGSFLEGHALKILLSSGEEYTIWRIYHTDCVVKNGEMILFRVWHDLLL